MIDVDSESGSQLRKDKTKQGAFSLICFDSGDRDRENEDDHSTFVAEGCGLSRECPRVLRPKIRQKDGHEDMSGTRSGQVPSP